MGNGNACLPASYKVGVASVQVLENIVATWPDDDRAVFGLVSELNFVIDYKDCCMPDRRIIM